MWCALVVAVLLVRVLPAVACEKSGSAAYVGTYVPEQWNPEGYVKVAERKAVLTWGPPLWMPARQLVAVRPDLFQMEDRAERQIRFERDGVGCVVAMTMTNLPFEGRLKRKTDESPLPLDLLLSGRMKEAFPRLLRETSEDPRKLVELGERMQFVPKDVTAAQELAELLTTKFPKDASTWQLLGETSIALGKRTVAITSFERAFALDTKNDQARRALEMLGVRKPAADLPKLPFKMADVFQPPTVEEIAAVRKSWQAKDARPRQARVLLDEQTEIHGIRFHMRVLEVAVGETRQAGVILVPEGAAVGKTPVLVEAKGVSWNFFPLRIQEGLNVASILGKDLGRFVLVAPGFRGERVEVGGRVFQSDSPHESWDGAAEDLLEFLNVALETTPQADPHRICVFGRSRGGTVALLAGERDSRIGCVVAWAAPTDWFELMAPAGWTQQQVAEDALRYHSKINEGGGQYVYNFLRYAVDGKESLADVRRRMIASSPLYFTNSLPATQVNYGLEDSIVPENNGRELMQRAGSQVESHFYPDAGHDQDLFEAPENARRFLLEHAK